MTLRKCEIKTLFKHDVQIMYIMLHYFLYYFIIANKSMRKLIFFKTTK